MKNMLRERKITELDDLLNIFQSLVRDYKSSAFTVIRFEDELLSQDLPNEVLEAYRKRVAAEKDKLMECSKKIQETMIKIGKVISEIDAELR